MSHSLSQDLTDIAKKHNIPMNMFDFEITESLIDDYDMIHTQIAGLKAMGADFLPDLIKLFQHSNMEIVVEGIETEEMKDKMAEMGYDYEQGYYFSKPLPPADFVKYMGSSDR